MMTELDREGLPQGWVETTLGEVVTVVSGIGFPHEYQGNLDEELPFYKVGDVSRAVRESKGRLEAAQHYISWSTLEKLKGKVIPKGTTVFAKIGEAIKLSRRAKITTASVIDNNVMGVIPTEAVFEDYLFRFMHTVNFSEKSRSTTVPSLRKSDIEEEVLPLPPLPEQRRIADKLDALLSRVDAGRERLERVPKLVKQFRQAVLSAAVSGELTREWRGGGDAEWEEVTVGDCIESLRNGISLKPTEHPTGVPILKISSVRPFSVRTEAGRFVPISQNEANIFNLVRHDLLVTRYNGSLDLVGVAGMVRTPELESFTYPDKLMRVRVNTSVLPAFLELVINAPASRVVIEGAAKTTSGQTGISGKDLKELSLLRPPLPEQAEIVRRVEALFAIADRLEARHRQALASFERLTPALLAKAFRGELVPQDPNDEPASALLERIQAQRAAEGEKPRRGRQPGKAAQEGGEPKRRGRPPKAQAEVEADAEQPRKRGRPPKVHAEETSIPVASSYEDAVRRLEAQKLQRAGRTRQVSLFDDSEVTS